MINVIFLCYVNVLNYNSFIDIILYCSIIPHIPYCNTATSYTVPGRLAWTGLPRWVDGFYIKNSFYSSDFTTPRRNVGRYIILIFIHHQRIFEILFTYFWRNIYIITRVLLIRQNGSCKFMRLRISLSGSQKKEMRMKWNYDIIFTTVKVSIHLFMMILPLLADRQATKSMISGNCHWRTSAMTET